MFSSEIGLHATRPPQIVLIAVFQHLEDRLPLDELARLPVAGERSKQVRGMVMQVIHALAIGVVVDAHAQLAQLVDFRRGQLERLRRAARRVAEIVAEGSHHRPDALPAGKVAVDDKTRAGVRRGVDVGLEIGMLRDSTCVMVIKIAAPRPALQRTQDCARIGTERDVEHRQFVAAAGIRTLDQRDFALCAGDEHGRARLLQAQLVQRADAVRVAVEDVIELHEFLSGCVALPANSRATLACGGASIRHS